jgi:hypothetical protein
VPYKTEDNAILGDIDTAFYENRSIAGFEVFSQGVFHYVFLDITSCRELKINKSFGGLCCLCIQG